VRAEGVRDRAVVVIDVGQHRRAPAHDGAGRDLGRAQLERMMAEQGGVTE
jgi:hypothetical protein